MTPLIRALLQKVLPLSNRQTLRPWPSGQRLDFPPGPAPQPNEPERPKIRSLLARLPSEWPSEYRSPALLPGWPRGLEDLLQRLADLEALRREDEGRPENERRPPRPQEFVGFLAEARGEQELGRTLATQPIEDWARTFVWPADAFGEAGWRRLVVAAAERRPLRQLAVEPGELPVGELEPVPSVDWVEMLVNVGLQSGRLGPAELARRLPGVSDRLAACQVERALLRDELSGGLRRGGGSLFAAFAWSRWEARRDERGNLPVEVPVQVGFGPFLEAVGARRRSWPSDLLDGLFLRRQDLMTLRQEAWRDALGASRGATAAGLLPRNVRALLLFVDALSRAPWRELSRSQRERPPQAWVRLAAGLVRAAYLVAIEQRVDALNRDLEVQRRQGTRQEEEPPGLPVAVGLVRSEADRPFIDAITGSRASPLLEWQNEEVEAAFAALVAARDELPAPLDPGAQPAVRGWDWELQLSSYNALTEALSAFVDSPYFSLLVEPPRTRDGFGLGAADTGEDLETPD